MQSKAQPETESCLRILKKPALAATSARNSRFIARLTPIESLHEVRAHVERLRREYPGAAHVVHAAVVGDSARSLQHGASDDGEPKGTAGRPALEVLKGSSLTNVLLTIERYFGGTKLGTGGLVRAYAAAARAVLQAASSEPLVEMRRIRVEPGYAVYEAVRRALCEAGGEIKTERFGAAVVIEAVVLAASVEWLQRSVQDATRGTVTVQVLES